MSIPGKFIPFLLFSIIGLLAMFPLFGHLGCPTIRLFDESRLAVSALEMAENHNYLVPHFDGAPEMWSTKPPLMIWLQVLCIKIFGAGEFAIRLPSALAGLLTILLLFIFFWKKMNAPVWGFFSAVILSGTSAYITEHGTRTGDYDALLTLFTTLYIGNFYLFLQNREQNKYWIGTCIFILLAVMTKGIAGLLFLPGLFIFSVFSKKSASFLLSRQFILGTLLTLMAICLYYGARELVNPGYLKVVYQNELRFRYFETNEGHHGPWYFYLEYIYKQGFSPWYIFSILGSFVLLMKRYLHLRRFAIFIFVNALSFLFVISYSETKIEWYIIPVAPLFAVLAATFFYYLFYGFGDNKIQVYLKSKYIAVIFFLIILVNPYFNNINSIFFNCHDLNKNELYQLSVYFRSTLNRNESLEGYNYCHPGYHAQLKFYVDLLAISGNAVPLKNFTILVPGDSIIVDSREVKKYLDDNYKYIKLKPDIGNISFLKIEKRNLKLPI